MGAWFVVAKHCVLVHGTRTCCLHQRSWCHRHLQQAPRPIFRDLSHSQLIDDIKCFWVNCEDPTTTLSQDNDSFDSGSDSEDVDTLDGSSDEELHGFENTAQNYDEHANVGSAEGFHHNRFQLWQL